MAGLLFGFEVDGNDTLAPLAGAEMFHRLILTQWQILCQMLGIFSVKKSLCEISQIKFLMDEENYT